MKTDFKTKFLQHLLAKKEEGGFTLIELLVVIIIIGILSAIALPSFLNQANKARQSEAKTYIGSMNRGQQAFYLENAKFVIAQTEFENLALGITTQTDNYQYLVEGVERTKAYQLANTRATDAAFKAYAGGVSISQVSTDSTESSSLAILCEGIKAPVNGGAQAAAGDGPAAVTLSTTAEPACGAAYQTTGS